MTSRRSFRRDKLRIAAQTLLVILFSSLLQNHTRAQDGNAHRGTDSVPFTAVDVEKWKQVTKLGMENGVLIGALENGEKLRMNRDQYLEFARRTGKIGPDAKTFTKVEIEPEYPGGPEAWTKYVLGNLHYPAEAVKNKIQGTVVVRFTVETDGSITGVKGISGPLAGLRKEAVNLVKNGGKWNPAIQNGRIVRAYKTQPVMFRIENRTEP